MAKNWLAVCIPQGNAVVVEIEGELTDEKRKVLQEFITIPENAMIYEYHSLERAYNKADEHLREGIRFYVACLRSLASNRKIHEQG